MDEKVVEKAAEGIANEVKNEAPKVMLRVKRDPMALVVVGTVSFVAGIVTAKIAPKAKSKITENRNKRKIKHDEKNASFKEVEPEAEETETSEN